MGPSASWVKDAHLELWLATELPGYFNQCLGKDLATPQQWGIRIADGKVFAGAGKPDEKALGVEKVALPGGAARLKITLPKGMAAITLVYSDSDDGKTQERLIGSSKVVFGETQSLGSVEVISDDAPVACKLVGGALKTTYK